MTIGELVTVLRAARAGGEYIGTSAAADIEDVLAELAEPSGRSGVTSRRHPAAGGLDLHTVDIGEVIRRGLTDMIEAHREVEAQRSAAVPG